MTATAMSRCDSESIQNCGFVLGDFRFESLSLLLFFLFSILQSHAKLINLSTTTNHLSLRYIPFQADQFAVVLAGWAFSYLKVKYPYTECAFQQLFKDPLNRYADQSYKHESETPENSNKVPETEETKKEGWVYQLQRTLRSCQSVLAPGGLLFILESRGVAYDVPTRSGTSSHSSASLLSSRSPFHPPFSSSPSPLPPIF